MNDSKAIEDVNKEDEVEKLRTKRREEESIRRIQEKEFRLQKVRRVPDIEPFACNLSNDIKSLAEALKSKSQMSCSLLNAIMNTLLESKENITIFLKVDGALPALLRALSGQNEEYQLIAARCICNLAMGSNKQSLQVLKASESYLMAHLSGKNKYIIEACLTALGNFSKHSSQNIELLQNQGFFPKTIHLLNVFDQNVQDSAVYALTQMIYHGYDFIKLENFKSTVEAVAPIFQKSESVAFLMSVMSSNKNFNNCLSETDLFQFYTHSFIALENALKRQEKFALYYLRIICNCVSEESGQLAETMLQNHLNSFKDSVKCMLQSQEEYLQKECLSLIGILLNHPSGKFENFASQLLNENIKSVKAVLGNKVVV